jgi:hypothetical protein
MSTPETGDTPPGRNIGADQDVIKDDHNPLQIICEDLIHYVHEHTRELVTHPHGVWTESFFEVSGWRRISWNAFATSRSLKTLNFDTLLDDVDPASVFQGAQHKLQHNISRAENTRLSRDMIEMMRLPGSGVACSFGATDDPKVRLQAIANLEKNTSVWLHANPAFFPNRMNDSAFQIAFSCRHLLHLVDITKPCQGVVAEYLIGSDSTCSIATSVSVHLWEIDSMHSSSHQSPTR